MGFLVGERTEALGRGGPGWGTENRAPLPFMPGPVYASLLSGCSWAGMSYNTSVNVRKCFLEFCEPSCQVIKPEEGVMRTPMCSQLVRGTGDDLICVWCLKWRHSCGDGVLNLWNLMLSPSVCVCVHMCVCACTHVLGHMLVTQSCQILCDPMDCSPPSSSVQEFSRQEYWSGLPFPSPW